MTTRRTALTAAALVTPALLAALLVARTAASAVLGSRLYSIDGTGLEIVDISDPSTPTLVTTIPLGSYGASITSVAAHEGLIAVAMPASPKTAPGVVIILDAKGTVLGTATVGANPDMVAFDEEGERLVVTNEGEPLDYVTLPANDPEGTVSTVDVERKHGDDGRADDRRSARDRDSEVEDEEGEDLVTSVKLRVRTAGFAEFNAGGKRAGELSADVRVFGPGASVAQDLEPEYVTIRGDRAYVTLQENNAIAEINTKKARVIAIRPLALKDHSLPGNGLDPSDKDSAIAIAIANAIANWAVTGMPLPDGIASFEAGGRAHLITANEGDARSDWGPYVEDQRIKDVIKNGGVNTLDGHTVTLDPALLAALTAAKGDAQLGRLKITTATGRAGGDGDADIGRAQTFGSRSVTIWSVDGTKVWDSGNAIERAVATALPANFNSTSDANEFVTRSDDKGPEPEGVAVGRIGRRTYAFVGIERPGGFVVFDVTNPAAPSLVEYVNSRDFSAGATRTTCLSS